MDNRELDEILEYLNIDNKVSFKNLVALSEAYVGKSDILLEAEKQLGIIRKELKPFNMSSNTKAVLKFNRLMEKQFGMELFGLHILPTPELEAYTERVGLRIENIDVDMKKYVIGDKDKGYVFAKDNGLCILVSVSFGILGDPQYTNEECMAIILHEVGHNFGDCMFDTLIVSNNEILKAYKQSVLDTCVCKALVDFILNKWTNKEMYRQEKKRQKNKFGSRLLAFLGYTKNRFIDSKDVIVYSIRRLFINPDLLDADRIAPEEKRIENRSCPNRQAEIIADKFPAIYGYSTTIVSALFKMLDVKNDKYYNTASKLSKVFGGGSNNFKYQEFIMKDLLDWDEHPNNIQRLHVALNTLENGFKKSDIDPKIKKEIKGQIDDIKAQLKEYTDASNKVRNIEKVQANAYEIINNTCPDATIEGLEDSIEKILDDKLNEIVKKENNRKKG